MSDDGRFWLDANGLTGAFVSCAEPGIGSMITIDLVHVGAETRADRVWLYLARWALLLNDVEVVASDMPEQAWLAAQEHVAGLAGAMVLRVVRLDDSEFHIDFSGNRRLEIWPDEDASEGEELVHLFSKGKHLSTFKTRIH